MKTSITFLKEKGTYALLLFCIFMGNPFSMISQEPFICLTQESEIPKPSGTYSNSESQAVLDATDPYVFNVYYWRVNGPDGQVDANTGALTEEQALKGIQDLNVIFNPIGIYFKYRGIEDITSPANVKIYTYANGNCTEITDGIDPDGYETLNLCQRGAFTSFIYENNYIHSDGINIYVPRDTPGFSGWAPNAKMSLVPAVNVTGGVIIHELGHNLGLSHTFTGWYSDNPNYDGCEHVTRDPNDIDDPNDPDDTYYNADEAGDEVVDTAAMPDFLNEYCKLNGLPDSDCTYQTQYGYYWYDKTNCKYTGVFRTDCQNTVYQIDSDNAQNFMAYAFGSCKNRFTIGQGIKMKETIDGSQNLQALTTDIASLYEPYKGEYPPNGIVDPNNKPLFQPGFHYKFVECDCECPLPSDYNDVSFTYTNNVILEIDKDEADFSKITHPNHTAIQIDFVFPLPSSYGQNTRRCYDHDTFGASSGSITRFNDGVFNNNVTITPKDSTGINNPHLVEQLPNGLYKIEKVYTDGSSEETVISKGQ